MLETEHDAEVAGYMGQDKTMELVRRNLFWPEIEKLIEDYVCSCPECWKHKAIRYTHYCLLQSLESAYSHWNMICMDFIIEFLVLN
jgi:hypothetical protein